MIFIKLLKAIGNFACIAVDTLSMFYLRLQLLSSEILLSYRIGNAHDHDIYEYCFSH